MSKQKPPPCFVVSSSLFKLNRVFHRFSSVMCGWTDADDEIEEEITLKGAELVLFTIIYSIAVVSLVIAFEIIMPVILKPDSYPFYNHKPDWSFSLDS